LLTEVGTVTAVSVCVVTWNALAAGYLDLSFHPHPSPLGDNLPPDVLLRLPALPFTLASPALGLLLVFRTNTSYARWLEARVAWGRIVAHLRNIQRQPAVWMDADVGRAEHAAHILTMRSACWTFAAALRAHLGGPEDATALEHDLRARLPAHEAEDVLRANHRPLRALGRLSRALNALPIDEKRRAEADKSIVKVGEATETCERIFSNPVPLVYTRHTARFLSAWLLLLPLGLWDQFGETWNHVGMVPAAAMAAIFLFGIEELAVQLEEPFSILPLDHLCEGVWEAAEEMHGAELHPPPPHDAPSPPKQPINKSSRA
jgi:predicted membrane chloride channel (bestrophin family)